MTEHEVSYEGFAPKRTRFQRDLRPNPSVGTGSVQYSFFFAAKAPAQFAAEEEVTREFTPNCCQPTEMGTADLGSARSFKMKRKIKIASNWHFINHNATSRTPPNHPSNHLKRRADARAVN